jgi:hypothetical protein
MKVTLSIERSKLVKAREIMEHLKNNADALLQIWQECDNNEYGTNEVNIMLSDLLTKHYKPYFGISYDELVNDIANWINPVSEEINKALNPSDEVGEPEAEYKLIDSDLRTFQAYQHFLYYFDLNLYKKEAPHGGCLNTHFAEKLGNHCDIKSLVNWVQEMSKENQNMLLGYILKHHSDKW